MKVLFIVLLFFIVAEAFPQSDEDARLNNEAVVLMDNEQYKEALPYLDEITNRNGHNTLFRYNRAVTLFNLKRYAEALSDYKILSEAIPEESEYVFQVGNSYEQLDSADLAIFFYSKAIDIEKDNFLYYFKRGTILLKQNKFTVAEADFNASLELNPKHDNSLHNRGIAFYKLGKTHKACEDWCTAYRLGNTYSLRHMKMNCPTTPCPNPR